MTELYEVPNLADDAPGDDRSDAALSLRSRRIGQSHDLAWLMQDIEAPEPAPSAEVEEGDNPRSFLGSVATGIGEAPRQAVAGVRDATQSMLDLADWVDQQLPGGGIQIFDPGTGEFDLRYVSDADMEATREAGGETGLQLPEMAEAKTMGGNAVRVISQFLLPFGGLSKAAGGIRTATSLGTATKAAGLGAATDFLAFDAHEERLSDLVQEFPSLQNPVTEYLAADDNDGEIEGRLKNAIEGLGIGVAAEGLFKGMRLLKKRRDLARQDPTGELAAEAARTAQSEQVMREAADLRLLGTSNEKVPPIIDSKMVQALKETRAGVPEDVVARSLTERGLTPLNGADDVYINFARISEPDDIQRIINDTAQAMSTEVDEARRGIRPNKETVADAEQIDAWDTLMKRRTGEPLNAEQSVAARQLWATSADKLGQVADAAATNPTPENLFQFRRMLATHHAIQKEVIAARSETARALQSWRIPVGGNLERMRDIENMLERAGGSDVAKEMAEKVAVLARSPNAAGALTSFTERSIGARTVGSVQEYWINSLLSGPKTHLVNMMSNTGVIGLSLLERGVAARLGRAFTDEVGVEVGEAAAQVAGLRGGIFDAFRNAGKALRTGQTGFGVNKIETLRDRQISSGNWNVRSDSWLGRGIDGVGAVVNVPGRLLQAEDEIFKTLGYRMELHAQAHRTVMREVSEGKLAKTDIDGRIAELLDNPPEAIRMEAVATAAYQTFTNEPGPFSRWVQQGLGQYPAARFILPFVNTPSNILKYTFERSPLAPLTSKYRNAIARGGADADLARTRMAMGTVGMMLAMDLAMNGQVTGSGPSHTSERQNWRRKGNQPYSLRLGDKMYAFNRLDPMGYHLGIAGDLAEYALNAEAEDLSSAEFQEAFAATVFSVAEGITSKSYMQGLSLLLEAINDPDRFGPSYLERFAASFVPTGVREVATFSDPVLRHSHDMVSAIKRRIPGMTEDVPARRDLWGREISYQSGLGKVYDAVSPIYASGYKPEPIDEVMAEDGWFIGMGGHSFTIDGERVPLRNRPDIKNRYYELRGGTKPSKMGAEGLRDIYGNNSLLETLNEMVQGKGPIAERWENAQTADDREKLARKVVRQYSEAAKARLFEEFPWIAETAARLKAQRLGE